MDDSQKKMLLLCLVGVGGCLYLLSKSNKDSESGGALGPVGPEGAQPSLALGQDTPTSGEPSPPSEPPPVITDPKALSSFDRGNPRHIQRYQQALNAFVDLLLYNKVDTVTKGPLMYVKLNPGKGDRKNIDNYDGILGKNTQGCSNSFSGFMQGAINRAKTAPFSKNKKHMRFINAIEAAGSPGAFGSIEYENKLALSLINAMGITKAAEYFTAPNMSMADVSVFKSLMDERNRIKAKADNYSGFF